MAKDVICLRCAFGTKGRYTQTGGFNDSTTAFEDLKEFIDGVRVREHRNQPSKKIKCGECGNKVTSFYKPIKPQP